MVSETIGIIDVVGFFGKIPAYGDFLTGGLPQSFIRPWDEWLRTGMAGLELRLGKHWSERFVGDPPLRFALAPGTCGPPPWLGILASSHDKVGRSYPLTLAATIMSHSQWAGCIRNDSGWVQVLEPVALAAVRGGLNQADIARIIRGLESELDRKANEGSSTVVALRCLALSNHCELESLTQSLAYKDLSRLAAPLSFWWTSRHTAGDRYAFRGLPSGDDFLRLIPGLIFRSLS